MFRNNLEFAVKMMHKFEFTESEMKYLLGENYSRELEKNLHPAKTAHEKQIENESVTHDKKEKDKKENKQQSLFDF